MSKEPTFVDFGERRIHKIDWDLVSRILDMGHKNNPSKNTPADEEKRLRQKRDDQLREMFT